MLEIVADFVRHALRIAPRPPPGELRQMLATALCPAGKAPRDIRSATRRGKTCSARRFPASARWPRDNRRTVPPFPRAISNAARHWQTRGPASATVVPCRVAGQHIGQNSPLGHVIMHVVGRHQRQSGLPPAPQSRPVIENRPAHDATRPRRKPDHQRFRDIGPESRDNSRPAQDRFAKECP